MGQISHSLKSILKSSLSRVIVIYEITVYRQYCSPNNLTPHCRLLLLKKRPFDHLKLTLFTMFPCSLCCSSQPLLANRRASWHVSTSRRSVINVCFTLPSCRRHTFKNICLHGASSDQKLHRVHFMHFRHYHLINNECRF